MVVPGLEELADFFKVFRCRCPASYHNMPYLDVDPEGWHDPPTAIDWQVQMDMDLDESEDGDRSNVDWANSPRSLSDIMEDMEEMEEMDELNG